MKFLMKGMFFKFLFAHVMIMADGSEGGGSTEGQAGEGGGKSSTGEAGTRDQATNSDSGNQGDQGAGTQDQANSGEEFSIESLPQQAQDLIKTLRSENAERRTKGNNLTTRLENIENGLKTMFGEKGQESTPEEQISQMSSENESLSYQNAVMGMAYENGIPAENYEYFNFLMDKGVNSLEEGQELSEEGLMEIIQKAKSQGASGMNNSNTSVDDKGKGGDPNASAGVDLDSFVNMSLVQKSELYVKSPDVYNTYMKQAREKRLLK